MSSDFEPVAPRRRGVMIAVTVGAVALLLVAVLLGAALLGGREPVAEASDSPNPSVPASPMPSTGEPSSSPQPSADPTPSPSPQPVVTEGRPFAAIVLVNELQLREAPGDGTPVAVLAEGDVVLIDGEPQRVDGMDWYAAQAGESYGWVAAGPDDDPYLDLRSRVARRVPATVLGMAGGDAGVLAWGIRERVTTDEPESFVAILGDDGRWTPHEAPFDASAAVVSAAHGPAGWLLVASTEMNTGFGGLWRSDDGVDWEPMTTNVPSELVPRALAGSPSGYALELRDDSTGTSSSAALLSSDGVAWGGRASSSNQFRFVAVGDGILAWDDLGAGTTLLYANNASSWTDVGGLAASPSAVSSLIGVADSTLVALTIDLDGELAAWSAPIPTGAGPIDWTRRPSAETLMAGNAIAAIHAVGDRAVAIGHSAADGLPRMWRTDDGVTWEELDASGIDDAGITVAAASGTTLAGAGHDLTDAGLSPRFWASTDGVGWAGESDPALPTTENAVVGGCPSTPATMLDWMAIPDAVGAECFGAADVTFTAWLTDAGGCGGFTPGTFEPEWLANPYATGRLILLPFEASSGGCGSAAGRADLEVPATQQWVEVTGHWADPEASSCRYLPDPTFPGWSGGAAITFRCHTTFVATAAVPADAP